MMEESNSKANISGQLREPQERVQSFNLQQTNVEHNHCFIRFNFGCRRIGKLGPVVARSITDISTSRRLFLNGNDNVSG